MNLGRRFNIGLSFPGEHRRFVRNVASVLAEHLGKERVFFDEWYNEELTGTALDSKLRKIYRDDCDLVVPFFSAHYAKDWCQLEWHVVRTILLERRKEDAVIPIHLDGTKIEGWEVIDRGIRKGEKGRKSGKEIGAALLLICKKRKPKAGLDDADAASASGASSASVASDVLTLSGISSVSSVSGDSPQKSQELVGNDSGLEHGFIVAADICDATNLPGRQLREVVELLWQTPFELGLLTDSSHSASSGMLHGLIVAATRVEHQKILDCCERWIRKMKSVGHVDLRIAVHVGGFYRFTNRPLIVGAAPSECSRILHMAGPGQIVISENFVTTWVAEVGDSALGNIWPELQKPPMEIRLKPGQVRKIRFYKLNLDNTRPPAALQQIHAAEQALRGLIEEIEDTFVDCLNSIVEVSARKVGARISLFIPGSEEDRLVSTDFRFLRYPDPGKNDSTKKGPTVYSVADVTRPQGTVGNAYVKCTVQVVQALPVFKDHPSDYIATLTAEPWNLPEAAIRQFGRKARCFIAIPFRLEQDKEHADGVVCIDTRHPLDEIPFGDLELIGEYLMLRYGTILAALWRLR